MTSKEHVGGSERHFQEFQIPTPPTVSRSEQLREEKFLPVPVISEDLSHTVLEETHSPQTESTFSHTFYELSEEPEFAIDEDLQRQIDISG